VAGKRPKVVRIRWCILGGPPSIELDSPVEQYFPSNGSCATKTFSFIVDRDLEVQQDIIKTFVDPTPSCFGRFMPSYLHGRRSAK